MKKFEKPAMEKVEFESNDVITTSGISGECKTDYCGIVCDDKCNVITCVNVCHPEEF